MRAGCPKRVGGAPLLRVGSCLIFFFQAEDGIRDLTVTGVQTCALPISPEKSITPGSKASSKRSFRNSISLMLRNIADLRCREPMIIAQPAHALATPNPLKDRKSVV